MLLKVKFARGIFLSLSILIMLFSSCINNQEKNNSNSTNSKKQFEIEWETYTDNALRQFKFSIPKGFTSKFYFQPTENITFTSPDTLGLLNIGITPLRDSSIDFDEEVNTFKEVEYDLNQDENQGFIPFKIDNFVKIKNLISRSYCFITKDNTDKNTSRILFYNFFLKYNSCKIFVFITLIFEVNSSDEYKNYMINEILTSFKCLEN